MPSLIVSDILYFLVSIAFFFVVNFIVLCCFFGIRIRDLESKSVVENLKVDLKAEAEKADPSVGTGNKT